MILMRYMTDNVRIIAECTQDDHDDDNDDDVGDDGDGDDNHSQDCHHSLLDMQSH